MLDTLTEEEKVKYDLLFKESASLKIKAKELHIERDSLTEYFNGAIRFNEINKEISKIHSQLTDNLIDPKFETLWLNKGVSFEERKALYDAIEEDRLINELVEISPMFKIFYEWQVSTYLKNP
jgi:hypothetical protein